MKPLSETLKEMGIAFTFPIEITDDKGNETYRETSNGYWQRCDRDLDGNETYYETSDGYWVRYERDDNGNETYCEDSDGYKEDTPRSDMTCEGKVVEVDGVTYKLTSL